MRPIISRDKFSNRLCWCGTRAIWGYPGNKPLMCAQHADDGMQDLECKRCQCGNRAAWGQPEGKWVACKDCKTPSMILLATSKCPCGRTASFGVPGSRPSHCAACKTAGMGSMGRKCLCGAAKPNFAEAGQKAVCCRKCRTAKMINVCAKRCQCGKKQPHFGYPGQPAQCCKACKASDMENVRCTMCKGCGFYHAFSPTDYLCADCNPHSMKRHGTKEGRVAHFLDKAFPEVEWTWNKKLKDTATGCNPNRAPDFITIRHTATNHWAVIVECDEDQHSTYGERCEVRRMEVLLQELGFPLAFVRFNPDDWQPRLPKHLLEQPGQDERHAELEKAVKAALEKPPESPCMALYLYYDKLHGQTVKIA